jgi:2-amino-4-hydroxy-6-hydroxymethyldihydropteridine diphosphokinase
VSTAVLSLGSNMGDRAAYLERAVASLGDVVRVVSSIYRTAPVGGVPQADFYNLTLIADDPDEDPRLWLDRCRRLEREAGREQTVRWGPRTLDADVITVDVHGQPVRSDDPELTLPHPRAAERAFVLLPWAEIDPSAELPGAGPITDLLESTDHRRITRVGRVH